MWMNKPLFWHQGLFLQPQHFQLNDLYQRSLVEPLYRYFPPHPWGVASLDFLESALANYSVDISAGELLFPDNTHAVISKNAVIQARSFEHAWTDGSKSFTVYAGLKKFSHDKENVSVVPDPSNCGEQTTRFVAATDPREVRDLHHTGPGAQVKQMDLLLRIFWESELPQLGDYLLIPVARLERSGEEILLSKRFIPPCITVSASTVLEDLIREIMDQLGAKTRQLEASKRDKGVHTAEFGSRDMVFMLALRSLNRYLPLLSHFRSTPQLHPWSLYGVLRQLAGELSSFSAEVSATGELADGTHLMKLYDHKELWECFSTIQSLITRLLDDITAGPEYVIPLAYDGTYFTAELAPQIFDGHNRFFLVFQSEEAPETLVEAVTHIAKLGARESLPILIAQSLPGIRSDNLSTVPQELPRKAGCVYFQLDHHGEQWAQVQARNNLALYWDMAPEDLTVELMVVRRS
ncbi:MAG: type VI secretion system baseplate subunit TssK [Desulfobacteraceae bacterium]|nr:type VI secretion system baseplate subunit TssK [Desulfobacteraceae bacterium]